MSTETDWPQWSRDAVAMMQRLNDAWVSRYRLAGARYHWDMNTAEITFHAADETVRASICVVGSTSAAEGTFLWSWANESIPSISKLRIHEVREFGQSNNLTLLRTGEWPGDTAAGLEMLAVASRILNAAGSWVEPAGDVTLFFALLHFRAGT